ncbi:MAG: Fe-S cluster assembly protein SufD [Elainella sp.]
MTIQMSAPTTASPAETRAAYLSQLLSLAQASGAAPQTLRDQAALLMQEQTLPSTRDEDWRFTDLTDLLALELTAPAAPALTLADLEPFLLPDVPLRLTFVNGVFAPELSSLENLPTGLSVGNLVASPADLGELAGYLAQQSGGEELFTALNTVGFPDAALIRVGKNQVIAPAVHLLFVANGAQPALIQPRSLVIAEANSSLTLIEDHLCLGDLAYFSNSVSELYLAENAQLTHSRIQRDAQTAFHIGKTAVSQARSSRYTVHAISLGGRLSRHNLEIYQTGEQTETVLNGLTVLRDQQLGDTHSTIALTRPYGTTRQLHKCIVDDRAHAVFNGKVFVPKAAQLTDAGQLNRNLLLSPKARVDTKPQLEIVADNVKCTHGATVGQLETDEIFYLQSRGIDAASARQLLVYAFAFEVIDQLPHPGLKQALLNQITAS